MGVRNNSKLHNQNSGGAQFTKFTMPGDGYSGSQTQRMAPKQHSMQTTKQAANIYAEKSAKSNGSKNGGAYTQSGSALGGGPLTSRI